MIRNLCRLAVACAVLSSAVDIGFATEKSVLSETFLASMTPPSVVRGGTTRVVLRGTDLGKPLDLWTSVPGHSVRAAKVAGTKPGEIAFDVTVAADAPFGLHGLRLATDDGLTNAIVFLIDDLAPTTIGDMSALKLPIAISGTFRPAAIDRFPLDVAAGEELTFECVASRFGKDADPLLRILDASGKLVFEYDNDPGLFFDFRVAHKFAQAGRYTVELCDARYHGADDWNYILRIGRFPSVHVAEPSPTPLSLQPGRFYQQLRHDKDNASAWVTTALSRFRSLVEVEPNDVAEQATKAVAPIVLSGRLAKPGDVDFFEFDLKKGDRLVFRAETSLLDSAADVELAVVGPDGKEMQRVDDIGLEEATLSLNANKDGVYRLMVHDVTRGGGSSHIYNIEAQQAGPQIALAAEFADLTIPQGDYQSLPLVLTRTEFTGPVQLSLVNAPEGVTIEPNVFGERETMLWARVRATDQAPLGIQTVRVVASADAGDVKLMSFARTQPLIDRQHYNPDLIPYAKRENQRRLPPSMTDRIALQITPPSPFTIETPEPVVTVVRYLTGTFPIHVSRKPGFVDALTFKADGGQLGEESEIRRQIYTRFVHDAPGKPTAQGTFYSRNQPQTKKDRVDLFTVGEADGRRVTLIRSFDLDLKAGFTVSMVDKNVEMAPGETRALKVAVDRVPPFTGAVTIEPTEVPGMTIPETIVVPADQATFDLVVKAAADMLPAKQRTRLFCKAQVGAFQEEGTPVNVDLIVKLPTPPKPEKPVAKKPDAKSQAKPATAKK